MQVKQDEGLKWCMPHSNIMYISCIFTVYKFQSCKIYSLNSLNLKLFQQLCFHINFVLQLNIHYQWIFHSIQCFKHSHPTKRAGFKISIHAFPICEDMIFECGIHHFSPSSYFTYIQCFNCYSMYMYSVQTLVMTEFR